MERQSAARPTDGTRGSEGSRAYRTAAGSTGYKRTLSGGVFESRPHGCRPDGMAAPWLQKLRSAVSELCFMVPGAAQRKIRRPRRTHRFPGSEYAGRVVWLIDLFEPL